MTQIPSSHLWQKGNEKAVWQTQSHKRPFPQISYVTAFSSPSVLLFSVSAQYCDVSDDVCKLDLLQSGCSVRIIRLIIWRKIDACVTEGVRYIGVNCKSHVSHAALRKVSQMKLLIGFALLAVPGLLYVSELAKIPH